VLTDDSTVPHSRSTARLRTTRWRRQPRARILRVRARRRAGGRRLRPQCQRLGVIV